MANAVAWWGAITGSIGAGSAALNTFVTLRSRRVEFDVTCSADSLANPETIVVHVANRSDKEVAVRSVFVAHSRKAMRGTQLSEFDPGGNQTNIAPHGTWTESYGLDDLSELATRSARGSVFVPGYLGVDIAGRTKVTPIPAELTSEALRVAKALQPDP